MIKSLAIRGCLKVWDLRVNLNRNYWLKRAWFGLCIAILIMSGGCAFSTRPAVTLPVDHRPVLHIGACPGESVEKTRDQLQPLMAYLEKKTGYRVELTVTQDYKSIISKMYQKQIDVAWFGPFSYILAQKIAGAQAFAGTENNKSGKVYYSMLIVHPETGIESVRQLTGHSLAFTDPGSTSGYLIPKAMLLKYGIDPDKDIKSAVFLGHHEAAIQAVKKRSVDAAAVSSIILGNMREKGMVGDNDYRIIQTSEAIPGSGTVWAYRAGLSADSKAKVKEAFFSANQEEGALGIFAAEFGSFVPVEDQDYDIIREISRLLGMDAIRRVDYEHINGDS
ncbi:phosphate/phosphite/phosphonate ABC transporter substrate-binding protein [Sporomusa aerivorans]|uniref:phosphate/phosphite/phosphonate ABC transporter substrate-binding protein n=1 Tax=Sporomusa aerivorans TaxID=204936 RepID=UPI00352A07BE